MEEQTIYFSIAFTNLVTWHGQIHELRRCPHSQRGGANWRNILRPYILLEPVRDSNFGFGTMYQRFFHKHIEHAYGLVMHTLVSEDVPCRDFLPAHVIIEPTHPAVSIDFWSGWPPSIPLPAPRPDGKKLRMANPFAKVKSKPSREASSRPGRARAAGSLDGHSAAAAAAPAAVAAVPLSDQPDGQGPVSDGEAEHGLDILEENVDEGCGGETDNPILEALMAEFDIAPVIPTLDQAPLDDMVITCPGAPAAAEEEEKATLVKASQLKAPNLSRARATLWGEPNNKQ